ncbi:MAG: hypothetical protein MR835_04140 [Erysipelotrichaceae bacterium]|nr:hypothetical protein [Erysipelotrichaceae bacterium]
MKNRNILTILLVLTRIFTIMGGSLHTSLGKQAKQRGQLSTPDKNIKIYLL